METEYEIRKWLRAVAQEIAGRKSGDRDLQNPGIELRAVAQVLRAARGPDREGVNLALFIAGRNQFIAGRKTLRQRGGKFGHIHCGPQQDLFRAVTR